MATLLRLLDQHADRDAAHLACLVGDEQRTYGELAEQVHRFACGLAALGLQPGDRVSLYLPNSVDYVVAFYGTMRAGMVANPINSVFTPSEVSYFITDCGAAALVTTPDLLARLAAALGDLPVKAIITAGAERPGSAPSAEPRPERPSPWWPAGHVLLSDLLASPPSAVPYPDENTPACLPYSSGTTGRSKGIIHTHDSLAMQAILSANHLQMRRDDVLLQSLPLVHLYPGNIIMGGLFTAGATMVVQPVFDPLSFAALLADVNATACAGVPTTYAMLCQVPEDNVAGLDTSALQVAFSAGAPLPSRIRSEFQRLYHARVLDCYGITEAAGNLTATLRYGDTPELSCGVPYPLTDVRIVGEDDQEVPVGGVGELIARGPQIMAGYWGRPEDTKITLRGGWLHTGDLARRDERGYFYIVDRLKDLIISAGYNVYPAEVEEVVQSHPDVAMCAVFGAPDQVKGEKPWAAVVPRAGVALDPASVEAHCRERLAAYKVPRKFLVLDDLPRSSVGKILRRELRRVYAPDAAAAAAATAGGTGGSRQQGSGSQPPPQRPATSASALAGEP
jgi:long-chain acyl-CoA synthetase